MCEYDVFVCHASSESDRTIVNSLVAKLEREPHNLKVFVPERDLKGDTDTIELMKISRERCKKFMVILTHEFKNDEASMLLLKHILACSEARLSAKIIPAIFDHSPVPSLISHLSNIDFTKTDMEDWFMPRLVRSIKYTPRR